jgi:hypothetical protein
MASVHRKSLSSDIDSYKDTIFLGNFRDSTKSKEEEEEEEEEEEKKL